MGAVAGGCFLTSAGCFCKRGNGVAKAFMGWGYANRIRPSCRCHCFLAPNLPVRELVRHIVVFQGKQNIWRFFIRKGSHYLYLRAHDVQIT